MCFISYFTYGQSFVTYKFGDEGQIKIPDNWTIFDGKTDKEIINNAVIASGGRYQPTPGKYTIVRSNGYKGEMTFTLKLSYTVLEQSQTISELRSQKNDIIEMLNNELENLKEQVAGTDLKLVKTFESEYLEIGGGFGGKISYIKQQGTKPQRKIVQYMLFKDNKTFLLTLGWDVSDESKWITEYNGIIANLKF